MAERRELTGWGRSTASHADPVRVESVRDVLDVVGAVSPRGAIPRGLGRSYGDQATNAGGVVLDATGLDALPSEIPPDGVVDVGGGASLHDLLDVIVPKGWFVPVSPGTRHVTIGGAIAADIHGKNHHVHGSMAQHLEAVDLLLADGSVVSCGPDDRSDCYWATVGGLGLTGVVVAARLRLLPIETSRLAVDTRRLSDLDELMAAMLAADETATYSVAWIDLMARAHRLGRSVLTTADFAPRSALTGSTDPLHYRAGSPLATPPWVPNGLLRPATVRAFNEAWFRRAPRDRRGELQTIARYFHPLDGVRRWNHIYGSRGFLQWQMVVPDGQEGSLAAIVERIAASGAPSFLAVLKRFGPANPGPLSFPLQGWTLAADFPVEHRRLAEVLDDLDRVVADAGGRVYLAKDGRLDPALVPTMYPRLDEWRATRDALDPGRVWQSDLSRRLGVC